MPSSTAATGGAVERSWVSVEAARRAAMGVRQQMILVTTYSCCSAESRHLHARTSVHTCWQGTAEAKIELSWTYTVAKNLNLNAIVQDQFELKPLSSVHANTRARNVKLLASNSIISDLLSPLGVRGGNGCFANWHVLSSLWACLPCQACPCLFTCLSTHILPYSRPPKSPSVPNTDDSGTLHSTPMSARTWPVETEPSFVKAKWTHSHPDPFSHHLAVVAAHTLRFQAWHFFKATQSCSKQDTINVTCKNKSDAFRTAV